MSDSNTPISPRQWLGRIINLSIALVLIGILLFIIDWGEFLEVIQSLSLQTIGAGFIVFILLNLARTYRYLALLQRKDLPVAQVFVISFYHNMMVRILPFKLGEFAYVVEMRNRLGIPAEEGFSSLFGSRLSELLMIMLVLSATLLTSGTVLQGQQNLGILLAVLTVVGGVVGFYYSGVIGHTCVAIARKLFAWLPLDALWNQLDNLATDFDRFQNINLLGNALFWTIFTYSGSFGIVAILLLGVGIDVSLSTFIILISISMFASAIPFNIAGFGAIELSWATSLSLLADYTLAEAASIGLMMNSFILLASIVTGILSFLWLNLRKSNQ